MAATRTITIYLRRPTIRERLRWYMLQAKLRVLKPFVRPMTADEWYAADCPPYAGQRAPWKLV